MNLHNVYSEIVGENVINGFFLIHDHITLITQLGIDFLEGSQNQNPDVWILKSFCTPSNPPMFVTVERNLM